MMQMDANEIVTSTHAERLKCSPISVIHFKMVITKINFFLFSREFFVFLSIIQAFVSLAWYLGQQERLYPHIAKGKERIGVGYANRSRRDKEPASPRGHFFATINKIEPHTSDKILIKFDLDSIECKAFFFLDRKEKTKIFNQTAS
jgi:hypothetical protein